MITYTTYEDSLRDSAGLSFLSKKETDLFLLLQCGMITYSQLAITGIHGNTEASGRLSLNSLESNGLVKKQRLISQEQTIVIALTTKGKRLALKTFKNVLGKYQIPQAPSTFPSSRQLFHRLKSNDFYFSYIAQPKSVPLQWLQEYPLPHSDYFYMQQPPRSDGLLKSEFGEYYIEQDNGTQSINVLQKKLQQYIHAEILDTAGARKTLVFCLASQNPPVCATNSYYSHYKTLLKMTKLWAALEKECGLSLDYEQFYATLLSSPLMISVSAKDLQDFSETHELHPCIDARDDACRLKSLVLRETTDKSGLHRELDAFYLKRLKSHFTACCDGIGKLVGYACSGRGLYAVPNHRLTHCIPYIMPHETDLKKLLFQALYCNGLDTTDWTFHAPLCLSETLFVKYGVAHPSFGFILFDTPNIDLTALQRIQYLVQYHECDSPLTIILLGLPQPTAEYSVLCEKAKERHVRILYTTKLPNRNSTAPILFYALENPSHQISFECDFFDEKLNFIETEVSQ